MAAVRNCNYHVEIIDAEAEGSGPGTVAHKVAGRKLRRVGMIVFGRQPSASTQQMAVVSPTCRAIKELNPNQKIMVVVGQVAIRTKPKHKLRHNIFDGIASANFPKAQSAG